jgi:hypothetical protein
MDIIKNCLIPFQRVSLADLDKVKLMNRTDLKFIMHLEQLPAVLAAIQHEYSILEIKGETIFNYDNTYFDTPDDHMFIYHHNGRANRFKVRVRNYVESDLNFLEIKRKNNKKRTIKERITKLVFVPHFTESELVFIDEIIPFSGQELEPKLRSYFSRFTMVNSQFTERVTVDLAPGFGTSEKNIVLNNLVIIEVKQSKSSDPALIIRVLQELKIHQQGFSKYCVGRALLEDNIKKNRFKPLLLKIKKLYLN